MKKVLFLISIIFVIIFAAIWWIDPKLHYNIHTVIKNRVYRSAQLPKNILQMMMTKHDIKSIINLRNAHPDETWYQNELALANSHHATLYNLALPAFYKPTRKELIVLTNTIAHAKRPILIHCRHGADRTGLASAIVLILRNNSNMQQIERQASWHYLAISPHSVGKEVLPIYAKWLNCNNFKSTAQHFREWLQQPNFLNASKVCQL